ncbi:MAG: SpvB/TcaC N-terminal domain-containing protein, partial [Bacteroidota bacterium]
MLLAQPQQIRPAATNSDTTVAGMMSGTFSIDKQGSMNYHIAVEVPPGTAGISPKLALSYNSNATNGYMGQGWSLQGLHKVERIAATIAQDGFWGTISIDSTARYSINGQRLMSYKEYGDDSCLYRTEIESWSKVTSYGPFSDPDSFKIVTKKGMVFSYGTSKASRVSTNDSSATWEWLLATESDLHQNTVSYSYSIDNTNGVSYPQQIDYTSGKNLSAKRHVYFNYETRPDTVTSFSGGNMQRYLSLLSNIQTEVNDTVAIQYQLKYDTSPVTGKSLLSSVTKCDQKGFCYPATEFTWQQPSSNYPDTVSTYQEVAISTSIAVNTVADVNADGISDLVNIWPDEDLLTCAITLGTSQGLTTETQIFTTHLSYPGIDSIPPILMDINGNGTDQIVYPFEIVVDNAYEIAILTLSYTTGSDTLIISDTIKTGLSSSSAYFQTADINGDGNGDLVFFESDDTGTHLAYNIGFSDGITFHFDSSSTSLYAPWIPPPGQLTFT